MPKLPDRWLDYSKVGTLIPGTPFIACKTPLKKLQCLEEKEVFTPADLVEAIANLGKNLSVVIDLTFTLKYYNKMDFQNDISHIKIYTQGKSVPSRQVVTKFFEAVDSHIKELKKDDVIAVHCTHGINRTGYLICRYMIDRLDFDPKTAIDEFNKARGHEIERTNYVDDLKKLQPSSDQSNWRQPANSSRSSRPHTRWANQKYNNSHQSYSNPNHNQNSHQQFNNREHRPRTNRPIHSGFNQHETDSYLDFGASNFDSFSNSNSASYSHSNYDQFSYDHNQDSDRSTYKHPHYGQSSYQRSDYNRSSYQRSDNDHSNYQRSDYDRSSYQRSDNDRSSYQRSDYDRSSYQRSDNDRSSYQRSDYNRSNYQRSDYDRSSYQRSDYNRSSYQRSDNDRSNYQRSDYDRSSYQRSVYDRSNYQCSDFNRSSKQYNYQDSQSKDTMRYRDRSFHHSPRQQQQQRNNWRTYADD